jgi:hypothetical protein
MASGAQRYYLGIDDLRAARGSNEQLSFHGDSPDALASELQDALRTPALFERWRALQEDPDGIDPSLGITDAAAAVSARQSDLHVDLIVTTKLPHSILKHRLGMLVGSHWTLRDVKSA